MSSSGTARLNWAVVALLAGVALIIGMAPVAWLAKRPLVALWFGAGMAALALLAPRKLTRAPTAAAYAFEFRQMLSYTAVLGLFWMGLYGALLAAGEIIRLSGARIPDPAPIAFYGTAWIAALLALFMSLGVWDDVRKRMALPAEGGNAWHPVVSRPDWSLVSVALLFFAVAVIVCRFAWPPGQVILAQFALVAIPGFFGKEKVTERRAVESMIRLFEACGYSVTAQPRIGDPEIDALLKPIDLFAERGLSSFAIEVKIGDAKSAPVEWTLGSSLRASASLYAREPENVHCMLVLLGLRADPKLKDFGEHEGIQVFEFHGEEVARLAAAGDEPETLRRLELAGEFLHLQPEPQEEAKQ